MFEKEEWYLFILAALLIGVVYYVGLKSDAQTIGAFIIGLLNTITGRDVNGQFQGVPKAA